MIAVMQFGEWGVESSESIRVTETEPTIFINFLVSYISKGNEKNFRDRVSSFFVKYKRLFR